MIDIRRVILRRRQVHLVLLLPVITPRVVIRRLARATTLALARNLLPIRFAQNLMLVDCILTRELNIELVVATDLYEVAAWLGLGVFVGMLLV